MNKLVSFIILLSTVIISLFLIACNSEKQSTESENVSSNSTKVSSSELVSDNPRNDNGNISKCSSAFDGLIRFNDQSNTFERCSNHQWVSISMNQNVEERQIESGTGVRLINSNGESVGRFIEGDIEKVVFLNNGYIYAGSLTALDHPSGVSKAGRLAIKFQKNTYIKQGKTTPLMFSTDLVLSFTNNKTIDLAYGAFDEYFFTCAYLDSSCQSCYLSIPANMDFLVGLPKGYVVVDYEQEVVNLQTGDEYYYLDNQNNCTQDVIDRNFTIYPTRAVTIDDKYLDENGEIATFQIVVD